MSRTNRNATGRLRGHVVHAACQPLERRVLLSLAPAGPEFRVNSHTIGDQGNARSAMDADGDFVVAWNGEGPGDTTGIFAQRYSANGASQGAQFRVNSSTTGTQAAAAIAADADGDFVIVWSVQFDVSNTDIHAQRYNAAGIPQGGEMQVNTYQTGVQRVPSVAMDAAGNFVVVWDSAGQDGSGTGVYAQCYDSSGVAQGSEFRVNITTANDQSLPKVAMDLAGNFAVTWSDSALDGSGLGTYTRRFNAAGVPQGGEFRVNTFTTGNQHDPAIGMDANGDFIIAWRSVGQDGVSDVGGIYAQRYDAAGIAQGGEFRVHTYTTGNQIRAQVAMDVDGDFVVGWNSLLQDGDSYGLYAQAFDAAGAPQGGEFRVNTYTTGSQRDTAVSRDHAGNTVIAWRSPQDGSFNGIYAQRYQESSDTAGPVVAGVFVGGSRAQPYTVYEAPLARVVVSFSEQLSDAGGPTGANSVTNPANWRVVHHDGATASDVAIATIDYGLNAASNRLEVTLNFAAALGAGGLQITATDSIHDNAGNALDGDLDGTPGGSAAFTFNLGLSSLRSPEFDVPSPPFGRQFHPALAADAAGNFVVAWESGGQDGSDFGVYARRFNASGVPLGAEFRVNTFTINSQINPAVAVDTDGDFVVVWESYLQDGSGSAVYAQRYNSAGVPQGAEFRVNTYTTGHQQSPAVAMDPDGAFIIAWGSAGQDGSDSGVYAKRYNAAGVLQGTEFRVNTYTTGWQRSPSVGADASGAFVVTWGGIGADGLNGVQGQRYDATGSPQGSEFNVVSDVQARPPRVAVDAQGGFAVAWSQLSQQLQERYALARRYDSTGAALGPAVTVAEPIHHGSEPAVATDRDGDFIVTWSHFMFSSDDGIWGRRFTAAGAPIWRGVPRQLLPGPSAGHHHGSRWGFHGGMGGRL